MGGPRVRQVLVTGAAGGIGSATVDAFLDAGFSVIGLDREPVEDNRPAYTAYPVDLMDAPAVEGVLSEVGPLHHVVSVAGGALAIEKTVRDFCDLPLEAIRTSIDQNLVTALITLRFALPKVRLAQGDRTISFTSSTDALVSYGLGAYAAAKAGILGLVRSLTGSLGREGIRINAIAPGDVPTARNEREWAHLPEWHDRLRDGTALGRLVTVEEVAQAFLAIAIALTSVTGQTLVVDSGQTVSLPSVPQR
jgi:NAD(P)-dependent dehydrogenase (short-subunit alcohol dehydrogenase family)